MIAPLVLTMGDPAGIGGELTLRAWRALRESGPRFFVMDDPARLRVLAAQAGWDAPIATIRHPSEAAALFSQALPVLPVGFDVLATLGHPDSANAAPVMGSIEQAVLHVMAGAASAVVTNPISKSTLYEAGFRFPGHTEWLQELTGSAQAVMMLASPMLRVVPTTVHVSLRRALDELTSDLIVSTGRIVAAGLKRDFGLAAPRLAVAGLNPHAGENGAMGDDEARVIAPAIAALRAEGIDATGPFPADTMFSATVRTRYDVALCMYHDQALIPIKTLDMENGVNITLGLPIIRTSPDHGTAFDIAPHFRAEPASLIAAIHQAAAMAAHRSRHS